MKSPSQFDEEFIPVWFHLGSRFYRRLKTTADGAGLSMQETLEEAVRIFPKLNSLAKETGSSRSQCLAQAVKLMRSQKRSPAARPLKPLVAYRWEKVSPEQRSQVGRDLARRRWGKRDANPERPA